MLIPKRSEHGRPWREEVAFGQTNPPRVHGVFTAGIMKRILWLLVSFVALSAPAQAQTPSVGTATVVGRGPFWRVWQATTDCTNAVSGVASQRSAMYTELGNGICYLGPAGQCQDSQDLIELTATGAVARHGPMVATFAANVNSSNAVDMVSASGVRLQGRVMGIYYGDPVTGRSLQIAAVRDCLGTLYPPNTVVYADCFSGLMASVRYVYTAGLIDQEVLLESPLPAPETLGFDSRTCRVQVWTQFGPAAAPQVAPKTVKREVDPQTGQPTGVPDLVDELLTFGDLWFPTGAAFDTAAGGPSDTNRPAALRLYSAADTNVVLSAKQWVRMPDGSNVLVESVDFRDLAAKLLAGQKTAWGKAPVRRTQTRKAEARGACGGAPSAGAFRVAQAPYRPRGTALDWTISYVNGSQTSWTFTNGVTYVITNNFTVGSGAATWQANTVLKYASNAWLIVYGTVSFPSSGAWPVFTSVDDNDYGAQVSGSTSVPYYAASPALWSYYESTGASVSHAHVLWAQRGIQYDENPGVYAGPSLASSAFDHCSVGVYVNIQNDTLYLSQDTCCNVTTPILDNSGSYSGSIPTVCALDIAKSFQGITGGAFDDGQYWPEQPPADSDGAVGLSNVVELVNEEIAVWSKATTTRITNLYSGTFYDDFDERCRNVEDPGRSEPGLESPGWLRLVRLQRVAFGHRVELHEREHLLPAHSVERRHGLLG